MYSVAISPDSTWLATASWDGTARTWAADGTPRAVLTGHQDRVYSVAISPDSTWLATAGDDGTARTWAADGTPRAVLTGHQRPGDAAWRSPRTAPGSPPPATTGRCGPGPRTAPPAPPRRSGSTASIKLRMVPRRHRPLHRGPARPVSFSLQLRPADPTQALRRHCAGSDDLRSDSESSGSWFTRAFTARARATARRTQPITSCGPTTCGHADPVDLDANWRVLRSIAASA